MRNLQIRSATQPDLDDVSNLVRFKGCYLLNDIKLVKTSHKHAHTIAIISDVEGTGELELRPTYMKTLESTFRSKRR
jgi:hypothetical protein